MLTRQTSLWPDLVIPLEQRATDGGEGGLGGSNTAQGRVAPMKWGVRKKWYWARLRHRGRQKDKKENNSGLWCRWGAGVHWIGFIPVGRRIIPLIKRESLKGWQLIPGL